MWRKTHKRKFWWQGNLIIESGFIDKIIGVKRAMKSGFYWQNWRKNKYGY